MQKKILILIMLFGFSLLNVKALDKVAYVDNYYIPTENSIESQPSLGYTNYSYYPATSSFYEFFDKDNHYNVIFEINNDSKNLGWAKFDENMNLLEEITIPRYLTYFGNAIYYNDYLYVIYGENDNKTINSALPEYGTSITMEIVKYNMDGKVQNTLEIMGKDTSTFYNALNKTASFIGYGTKSPFNVANCDIAVNKDGVIAFLFGRQMYNGHQSSFVIYVDADTLKHYNKSSDLDFDSKYYFLTKNFFVSHSFDQRILATEDNNFLLANKSDGTPERAFIIDKSKWTSNNSSYLEYATFHFRESTDAVTNSYNYTMADMGNLVELDDGYLFVSSSEKTLSLNYALKTAGNESRNIFIQKFDKNFEGKTTETLQLFKTEERKSESKRTDKQNNGSFFLNDDGETDYGVKWLTNYNLDKTVLEVRAFKLNNNQVIIIWAEKNFNESTSLDNIKYYYEIIDNNGNIVKETMQIDSANPSTLIHYNVKNNYIYWTEKAGDKILKINKLDINKTSDAIVFERVGKEEVVINDSDVKTYQFSVNTNKSSKLSWYSAFPNVATVDDNGLVTIKGNGTTIIQVTNSEYNKKLTYTLKVDYKVKNIIPDTDKIVVGENKSYTLRYKVNDNANLKDIDWTSSSDEIFTVENIYTSSVTLTGKKNGKAKLIGVAKDGGGARIELDVEVGNMIKSLTFEKDTYTVEVGKSVKLNIIKDPIDSNEGIIFDAGGTNGKAEITEDGVLTVKQSGTFNVFAYPASTYSIYAKAKIIGIETTLNKKSMHLTKGKSEDLILTTYPNDYNPQWESDKPSVARVDSNGKVTAVSDGQAKITVTTSNGLKAECIVTVGDYIRGDLTRNGSIEVSDATEALLKTIEELDTTEEDLLIADFDENGKINASDATEILLLYINSDY